MSANPSHTLADEFRHLQVTVDSSRLTTPPTTSLRRTPSTGSQHAGAMSELLPADDGMAHLRMRIHEIRDLNISDQERARLVHSLMTERYNLMRPTSPASFTSHDRPFTPTSGESLFSEIHASSPYSSASDVDPENPYNLREGDTTPTYRPTHQHHGADHGDDEEDDAVEGELALGCQHYKRNVKVQCYACRRWYTCRHCHDAIEDHNLNRSKTQNMLCMACGTPQRAADHCKVCELEAACYYCDICKLWDNNSKKKIYHCPDCGICRRGEGLGKDFYHCKACNVCISISHAITHKCLPRATEGDCPICGDHLFTSSTAVVSMPCGHYLHKGCYNLYMQTAYKCPICKKSAVCMDLQWQKLTQAIAGQPMPEQFANTRAIVQCNDCSAKSSVKYHWLGNQCGTCDSYNTNELRILNGPESEETANAILDADADADAGSTSPVSVSSPASQAPLSSPRYYFTPDEPEETWLPGQLPSLFQIPQFPGRPRMPQMPQMPQFPSFPQFPPLPNFPQIPQFPQMPQMPQMPDAAQQMLERVRRSFDAYLNPTGDIRAEDVPFIDLAHDDRRERSATDGTTVQEPSLPQYVLERFTQSLLRFRNDLNPGLLEEIPTLDLSQDRDPAGLQFWGEDGERLNRFVAGDEGDEEDDSSSDESERDDEDEEEDDDDDTHVKKRRKEFDIPGHV
ncbi:zf-CHY-domain-containing protein [Decorospora gaudefroyi]|uniref:Zf-CHY-domain-containing protein n=1 Tax=Decorospora gaudefroyi TaxID=184978 RepID=A0A6A5KW78_9PLEO|nr:zf-CHY-domain-containing protein [Decorospora gaudefroyi]